MSAAKKFFNFIKNCVPNYLRLYVQSELYLSFITRVMYVWHVNNCSTYLHC